MIATSAARTGIRVITINARDYALLGTFARFNGSCDRFRGRRTGRTSWRSKLLEWRLPRTRPGSKDGADTRFNGQLATMAYRTGASLRVELCPGERGNNGTASARQPVNDPLLVQFCRAGRRALRRPDLGNSHRDVHSSWLRNVLAGTTTGSWMRKQSAASNPRSMTA